MSLPKLRRCGLAISWQAQVQRYPRMVYLPSMCCSFASPWGQLLGDTTSLQDGSPEREEGPRDRVALILEMDLVVDVRRILPSLICFPPRTRLSDAAYQRVSIIPRSTVARSSQYRQCGFLVWPGAMIQYTWYGLLYLFPRTQISFEVMHPHRTTSHESAHYRSL